MDDPHVRRLTRAEQQAHWAMVGRRRAEADRLLAEIVWRRYEIALAAGLEVGSAEPAPPPARRSRSRGPEAREMERMVRRRGARQPRAPTIEEDAAIDANLAAALARLQARAGTHRD